MTGEELDRINRAEEIQLYTENRCKALEKENAELKAKWLQATDEGTSWAHLKSLEKENGQLKAQIEKMTLEEIVDQQLRAIECLVPFPCKTRQYINGLKHQIFKMRCCSNCKHYCINNEDEFDCCYSYNCTKFDRWEFKDDNLT